MNGIKAVGFDLFNTLITVEPHALHHAVNVLSGSLQEEGIAVELACARALRLGAIGYQSVKNILKKGLEAADPPEEQEPLLPLNHDNLRGSGYYAATGGVQ